LKNLAFNSYIPTDVVTSQLNSNISYTKQLVDGKVNFSANARHSQNTQSRDVNITLPEFIELRKLNKVYASRKLILLVLANVLKIHPTEKGDYYTLANPVKE